MKNAWGAIRTDTVLEDNNELVEAIQLGPTENVNSRTPHPDSTNWWSWNLANEVSVGENISAVAVSPFLDSENWGGESLKMIKRSLR